MNHKWYAVWTRSRHEFVAAGELERKGFTIFLPTVDKLSSRKDRRKVYTAPLFPGYLFVQTEMDTEHYVRIVRSVGVAQVLGYHMGKADPVREEEIESIKIILDGKIPVEDHPFLPEGSHVRVLTGPLKGVVGILKEYRGKRRIVVQVELLRQAIACELTLADVVPIETISLLK